MIDTKLLSAELTGVVGLYEGFTAESDQVADYHQEPSVYLSDAHKLLSPEKLTALGPNLADIYPQSYKPDTKYKLYELVVQDSKYYESLTADNIGEDLEDVNKWRETTLLSAWYGRIERGGIVKLARLLAESPVSKPLLQEQPLYSKEGNVQNKLTKTGRFVGIRIYVKRREIALYLGRIGLQLSGPVANLPLYIFHSSQSQPITTVNLTGTTSGRTVWANVNRYLYADIDNSGVFGPSYYLIGYFENDLPPGVQAIGAERSLSVTGCSGCNPGDYELIKGRAKYADLQAIYVDNPGETRLLSWPQESEVRLQTWGLNLIIEARCNVTQTLLQNGEMLTNALLHVIACDMLEYLSTSDRVNAVAATLKNQAYVALYGQVNAKTDFGLNGAKTKLISGLKEVMSEIAPTCMASEAPKRKIEFGSIFD